MRRWSRWFSRQFQWCSNRCITLEVSVLWAPTLSNLETLLYFAQFSFLLFTLSLYCILMLFFLSFIANYLACLISQTATSCEYLLLPSLSFRRRNWPTNHYHPYFLLSLIFFSHHPLPDRSVGLLSNTNHPNKSNINTRRHLIKEYTWLEEINIKISSETRLQAKLLALCNCNPY